MIQINVNKKGLRASTILALVEPIVKQNYPDAGISVKRADPVDSRADRWQNLLGEIADIKSEAEGLRDELQEWYDNLPEQFQSGEKGEQLTEAISQIDEFISNLDSAESTEVEFPGAFGN